MIISTAGWLGSPNASVQSSASPDVTIFSVIRTIVPPSSALLIGHGSYIRPREASELIGPPR